MKLSRADLCEFCSVSLIRPSGPPDADVLVAGYEPTPQDLEASRPFTGQLGDILRTELAREGIDLYQIRATYLWGHAPVKETKKIHPEFDSHLARFLEECKGRKMILLLGTDLAKMFLSRISASGKVTATSLSGLTLSSPLLSASVVMTTLMPTVCISGVVGEFRLAIQRFAKQYREMSHE